MARHKPPLYCSFCRKDQTRVARLIAGPGVYICDACVGLCNRILDENPAPTGSSSAPGSATPNGDTPREGGSTFLGWESLSVGALLDALAPSIAAVDAVRDVLQEQIDLLRTRGVSWAQIGAALGISRQAAWERFS